MNLLDALYVPAAVLTAPWWARKNRSGWRERFGHVHPLPPKPAGTKRILLHAVSVGEVGTLRGLVPLLRELGHEVVVCASTDTGLARATTLYAHMPGVFVRRFALDFSPAVDRLLTAVAPDAVALVELEVWPNFIAACGRKSIPVCVINGRLSARSFKGYARFRRFFQRSFRSLAFAAVQDADYAKRFQFMGVPAPKLHITGSMKWDATTIVPRNQEIPGAKALAKDLGIDLTKPLIVAGSTAPIETGQPYSCEEALIAAACPPGTQLLCAPRKPEHFDAAFAALGGTESCTRRSSKLPAEPGRTRFLLDTIGELRLAYSLADIAIVGRSFAPLGGSDPIEPISLSRPTLIGPHVANFQAVVDTLSHANALKVVPAESLGLELNRLLSDRAEQDRLIAAGHSAIRENQGATARHAALLDSLAQNTRTG